MGWISSVFSWVGTNYDFLDEMAMACYDAKVSFNVLKSTSAVIDVTYTGCCLACPSMDEDASNPWVALGRRLQRMPPLLHSNTLYWVGPNNRQTAIEREEC